ncbi:MAG: glycosyltransferase, partial [Clostridiaceae bacterium]|nr:glycosyltransferase [Clostridiaceae bacterium]
MDTKREIIGIRFDDVTMEEALGRCGERIARKAAGYVVTPNAEMVYAAKHDPALAALLNGAALVVPDGIGVIYASRILGRPLRAR